jgi:hypothetical protein
VLAGGNLGDPSQLGLGEIQSGLGQGMVGRAGCSLGVAGDGLRQGQPRTFTLGEKGTRPVAAQLPQ